MSAPNRQATTGRGRKRHHTEGTARVPDDVVDPHTWRDESKTSKREVVKNNSRLIVAASFLILVILGILGIWFGRFIPQVFSNIWVQRITAFIAMAAVFTFVGMSIQRSAIENVARLVLIYPDDVRRYLGYYREADDGTPLFVPVKGFDFFGLRGRKMTLGDMSSEMARQFAKSGRSANDEAVIRLHPSMAAVRKTATGVVVAQLTGSLEPDDKGQESDIEATIPPLADEERMNKVKTELEKQVSQVAYLKDKVSMLEEQKNNYRLIATETEEEVEDRVVRLVSRLVGAQSGMGGLDMGGGMGGGFGGGMGGSPEPDYDEFEEEVEEELDEFE